jgi:hypothetical protein
MGCTTTTTTAADVRTPMREGRGRDLLQNAFAKVDCG